MSVGLPKLELGIVPVGGVDAKPNATLRTSTFYVSVDSVTSPGYQTLL